MKDKRQQEIFAKNLNNLLADRDLTQLEVAKVIGVSAQTFNTWCRGVALPRMDKIQRLADYFHINKSDLIDAPGSIVSASEDSLFIKKYGQSVFDAAMMFSSLDDLDRGKILERMNILLDDPKYAVVEDVESAG